MFNLRGSLGNCLTVFAFLFLTVLAAQHYGNINQKTNSADSVLYQKSQSVFNTVWSYAKVLAGVNLIKNVGVGNAKLEENIKNEFNDQGPIVNSVVGSNNSPKEILSNLGSKLKTELMGANNTDVVNNDLTTNPNNNPGGGSNNSAVNSYDVENNRPMIDLTGDNNAANVSEINASNNSNKVETNNINDKLNNLDNVDLKKEISSFISSRKTADGIEIIFTSKNGSEYKLPLPFKFLAK
ncbi:MAG: hypothetical protein ACYC40_02125 [Patescibacteria group bacterium]